MTYTLDIEIPANNILLEFVQVEKNPVKKTLALLKEDRDIVSIALRDENRKLIKIFDWRDIES